MSKSNPKTQNKFGKKKTVKSHPQTLTLIPKSDEIQAQEPKKPKGEKGKGMAYLAVVHAGARGKESDGAGARCSLSLGFIAMAERGEESGEERKKREKGRGE